MNLHNYKKLIIAFTILLVFDASIANAQKIYKWINIPYLSNNMTEYLYIDEYLNLHGQVESIKQYVGHSELPPGSRDLFISYNKEGKVTSVKRFISDNMDNGSSSYTFYNFYYNASGNLTKEEKTHIDKGDTIITKKSDDVSWFSLKAPDPIRSDPSGRPLICTLNGDTTFSFYDSNGRKVLDSIPDSGHTMAHKLTYTFYDDSITVRITYPSTNKYGGSISYKLDDLGNWIEKKAVYNNNALFTARYTRRITYYE